MKKFLILGVSLMLLGIFAYANIDINSWIKSIYNWKSGASKTSEHDIASSHAIIIDKEEQSQLPIAQPSLPTQEETLDSSSINSQEALQSNQQVEDNNIKQDSTIATESELPIIPQLNTNNSPSEENNLPASQLTPVPASVNISVIDSEPKNQKLEEDSNTNE